MLGGVVGSVYPSQWVQQHPYVKAARALLDGCFLHRREVQDLRWMAALAADYGSAYVEPALVELSAAPMPPWLLSGAAMATAYARRRRR
jgi:hypothetical protein